MLFLIAEIAGQRVAFDAQRVEAVADLGPVTPVPFAPPHVVGIAAIRSQVVTVIDGALAVGAAAPTPGNRVVLIDRDTHRHAVRVDRVIDVLPLAAPELLGAIPLDAGWQAVTRGRVTTSDGLALLIDTDALLNAQVTIAA